MEIYHIVILLGLLILSSHIFNALFSYTKIPNVLLLFIIGLIVGPIGGWIDKSMFGEFGSVFTTITLIIILFESGIGLKFKEIGRTIGGATLITVINFLVTFILAALLANFLLRINWLGSVFLGAIIGGTSSAVVIPMVKQLQLSNKSQSLLYLESALSDVLCLVVGLAVLEGMKLGALNIGGVFSIMWKSFLFALIIGLAGGFIWAVFLKKIRGLKNSMFTSFAIVFVLYGIVESLGFNGGISALSFGIILGNSEALNNIKLVKRAMKVPPFVGLNDHEKNFFGEIVFVLQTYFFVYIGICIEFSSLWTYIVALIIVTLIILTRPFTIRILSKKGTTLRDVAITSIMSPKGLVAAVLASLPFQCGLIDGDKIQDLGFAVVLISIVICSALVILISKDPVIFTKVYKHTKFDSEMEKIDQRIDSNPKKENDILNNDLIDLNENQNKNTP
ncbi:MAG: cation:proton antiporter [Bacteroidota bacterium]